MDGDTARITLNRPEVHNALSIELSDMLSAGLSGAVNGAWEVADADQFAGIKNFTEKGDLWKKRRGLAKNFWSD